MIVHVVDKAGKKHSIDATNSPVLMVALREIPDGVQGVCGGVMACGTCHVYIARAWLGRLPAPSADEQSLLEVLSNQTAASRLSCQIRTAAALDGLELTIAPGD